jgi:co-chaperonin GroES (HSP10)
MQNNYKLKLAVLAALGIIANSAFALSLGNMDVKSHLGQPLRATVKIQGISELKAADLKGDGCFRLIDDASLENALTSARFKLSNIVNDEAILTVTTSQIINEPITNMAIIAACDANIRRDYALLLDPAPIVETKNRVDEESTVFSDDPVKAKTIAETQGLSSPPQHSGAQAVKARKASNKERAKQSSSKKTNKNIVLTTGFNAENADATKVAANTPKTVTKNNTPRLSISSGDMVISQSLDNPNLSTKLMLDKQLHLSPETSPEAYSHDIAVQDEVTVMNNRLAHLQTQISTLQQRNATLEAESKLKAQLAEQEKLSSSNWQWLTYLAGAGLLAGGYFAADWWRRRRQLLAFNQSTGDQTFDALNEHDDFFDFDKDQALNNALEDTTQHFDLTEEDSADKLPNAKQVADEADEANAPFMASNAAPFSVEEFNEDQNILDHADVFLSHGRTSLAIQLLQNHLLDYPKQSVTIWLFLLELLARENMEAVYEQATLECKEHFNIRVPKFSNDETSEKQGFEDFPRLTGALQEVWGTPAAQVFLDDLIYNSRLENRIGFEKMVIEELLLLKNIANETLNTAEVIHMDEKKLALKERKEAQLATKKAEKQLQMNELAFLEAQNKANEKVEETQESAFEFNLVEYN